MSNPSTPQVKRESLDKKVIKLIGYWPTCSFSGAMIGASTCIAFYLVGYFDFSQNLLNQIDNGYTFLVSHMKIVVPSAIFGGFLVGLAIGLLTSGIKNIGQKLLASSVIGLIVYLFAAVIWRTISNGSITDSLDYLRFFASQLSLIGIVVGLLVSLLPQPETQS